MTQSNTTTALESQITSLTVSPGTAACIWLDQGGYLFKSPQGGLWTGRLSAQQFAEEI